MADLIDEARARLALPSAASSGSDDTAINTLITACSKAIEQYCRRTFGSTSHDELYNGSGTHRLQLRNYPILSVQSVRYQPTTVLQVKNTSSANQQARVSVTSTGLTLVRVASGSSSSSSLTFAGNVTLNALKSAIDALGNGWSATVPSGYESWPSGDLYPPIQGAFDAAGRFAELKMHVVELAGFEIQADHGWLIRSLPYSEAQADLELATWPMGVNNVRVQYTAGYATVPEDVQEACAQLVAHHFRLGPRETPDARIPRFILNLLKPYRQHFVDGVGG